QRTMSLAGQLASPDKRFAKWAKAVGVQCGNVKDDEKQDMIHELDAVVAHLYGLDRKSTRLNSSHVAISYAVFCLKKKKTRRRITPLHLPLIHHNLCGRPISQTENF